MRAFSQSFRAPAAQLHHNCLIIAVRNGGSSSVILWGNDCVFGTGVIDGFVEMFCEGQDCEVFWGQ